ncbi:MAG: hypothetical protein OXG17_02385 [Chloroflexi bacterium]|nr:hypothetical protein [Chloroflexota bacterium]
MAIAALEELVESLVLCATAERAAEVELGIPFDIEGLVAPGVQATPEELLALVLVANGMQCARDAVLDTSEAKPAGHLYAAAAEGATLHMKSRIAIAALMAKQIADTTTSEESLADLLRLQVLRQLANAVADQA